MSAEEEKDAPGGTPEEPAVKETRPRKNRSPKPKRKPKPRPGKRPRRKNRLQEKPPRRKKRRRRKSLRGKEPAAAKRARGGQRAGGAKEAQGAKAPAKAPAKAESKKRRAARHGASKRAGARRRVVRAHARYVRTSARKARMVCGHLRGKSVQEARAILAFTPRDVARDWSKLLESAVANAENNHELLEDDLIVREAYADEGPTLKRFRPRAMGRASPIRKRTSHLTITLTSGPEPRTTKR